MWRKSWDVSGLVAVVAGLVVRMGRDSIRKESEATGLGWNRIEDSTNMNRPAEIKDGDMDGSAAVNHDMDGQLHNLLYPRNGIAISTAPPPPPSPNVPIEDLQHVYELRLLGTNAGCRMHPDLSKRCQLLNQPQLQTSEQSLRSHPNH